MTGILNILAGSISSAIKDGYFNLVSLLLPGNGTNGAQNNTFLDSSSNNFTITRNGNTTQGTFSPFSQTGWSNYFDGTGDYLTGTITAVNNTTMTMECWVWFVALDNTDGDHIVQVNNGTNTNYALIHNGNGSARFLSRNNAGGAIFDLTSANSILQTNKWHHIVGVRNASAASLYVDGTRVATVSSPTVSSTDGTSFQIAYNAAASPREPNAYISNVRIVSGTAVYDPTSSSLTVPTSPLTAVSGARILTCESNRFVDNSGNNVALTITGTPSVQAFSPFAPTAAYSAATNGGSGYFDGSGDFLSSTSTLTFSTNPFTVEFWIYPTAAATQMAFCCSTNGAIQTQLVAASGQLNLNIGTYGSGATLSTTGTPIKLNQWNHIVAVRSSTGTNGAAIFVNGSRSVLGTVSTNYVAGAINVGAIPGGTQSVNGYMSGMVVTNGTANYSVSNTSITVPTAPPSPTGSTLCLNFTNAGITDATAKNVLETVGNAQISTTQSKFGGSSMYFDGTGDYLYEPNNINYDFGSGDFTIEFWMYTAQSSATIGLVSKRSGGGAGSTNWLVQCDLGAIKFYASDGTTYQISGIGGGSVSNSAWHHVAVTRSGSSFKVFVDGTQVGSTGTWSGTISSTSRPLYVGVDDSTNAYYYNGYIDDLRITKGYARYTASFTPPTAAFATQ